MRVSEVGLCGPKLITARRHEDERGWFAEAFNQQTFAHTHLPSEFAQDNHSFSKKGVLRGLHVQVRRPQGKLIRVLSGCIWDVAVDLRRASPNFGQSLGLELQPFDPYGDLELLWVPEGFAHGFLVLSETAEVLYKVTQPYDPGGEQTILWNDSDLKISWPLERIASQLPTLSVKDAAGVRFRDAHVF